MKEVIDRIAGNLEKLRLCIDLGKYPSMLIVTLNTVDYGVNFAGTAYFNPDTAERKVCQLNEYWTQRGRLYSCQTFVIEDSE